jgi:MoxR-like ATPase
MTENGEGSRPTPEQAQEQLEQALFEIRRIIAGQDAMLERVLVCLLAQGHLLIEGVPGLAKTLTIKTTAGVLGGSFARVQFTPDLVPSDLVGTRIYRPQEGTFDTELGPVFCNFLLADEINRAPAKVQSALLEVMQERQVTIGHDTHRVPAPFLVMATQNPIESEGTYPLPEAQIDRFLLKVLIGYPQHDEELTVVQRQLVDHPELKQVLSLEDLAALQRAVFDVYVDPSLVSYAVDIATATREPAAHGLPDSTSHTVPAPAGRSASCRARARSRWFAAGITLSPTTCRRSRATRSGIDSCSPTRRSPRKSRRTRSSTRCSRS